MKMNEQKEEVMGRTSYVNGKPPWFTERLNVLAANIESVIIGKKDVVNLSLVALLCRGHLLIEDVPGLGKTMLARTMAGSLALQFKRVQFTPDLLPSDITGVSIFNQIKGEFEFKPGPIFTNILLADEINRASPRTQSSLLECMEEMQVTVDGTTNPLPPIFMVIATQNPIELHGTYPLPEAQLDRFFMRIKVGYPFLDHEVQIMKMQIKEHPIHSVHSVVSEAELREMQEAVKHIHIDETVLEYIVKIVNATRKHPNLILGASPRGSLNLMRASQAQALIQNIDYVEPSLLKIVAKPVLTHRVILKPQARLQGVTEEQIIEEILTAVPVPVLQ
jgi:MoxR-like ATPase